MSKSATTFLAVLFLLALAAVPALANQYPPGPTGTCLDSVSIYQFQNPAASCHPVDGDTAYGMGGIVTGIRTKTAGAKIYVGKSHPGNLAQPWCGVQVFTGNGVYPIALGDSVVWELGQRSTYQGETENMGWGGGQGPIQSLRKVNSGAGRIPMHTGTVNELQWLGTNPNADQWEGALVKVSPASGLRVTRNAFYGSGTFNTFLCVDNGVCPPSSVGPCDSLWVDGNTIPTTGIAPPAVGTILNAVQGDYGRATPGYKVQLRAGSDLIAPVPPVPGDAYSVHADTIRVTFDRAVTPASAQTLGNYTLSDASNPTGAVIESDHLAVDLYAHTGMAVGGNQSVTVNNLVDEAFGVAMTNPVTLNFFNGVMSCHDIRVPNSDSLAAIPCVDKSRYSGPGSAAGNRLTVRGICIAPFGANPYIQDNATGTRLGVQVYGGSILQRNHQYMIACNSVEFSGETELNYISYVRDEGLKSQPPVTTIAINPLTTNACDASESILNGKDYVGQLVKLVNAKSVENATAAGNGFLVAGPITACPDTISINSNAYATWTYQADSNAVLDITGCVRYDSRYFTNYRVCPRDDADFLFHYILGVGPQNPNQVSFSVYPNPARVATVSFALPRRDDVELAVFDVNGRRMVTLAKGSMPAGQYKRQWGGEGVNAGMYFVRLRVGNETYNLRAVRLK